MQCEWNYGQSFFIMLSLIPSSIFLSSWVVARFIWLPWITHLNSLPEPKISYEKRYIITDDDIECLNENKDYKSLKDKTLTEETPLAIYFFVIITIMRDLNFGAINILLIKFLILLLENT